MGGVSSVRSWVGGAEEGEEDDAAELGEEEAVVEVVAGLEDDGREQQKREDGWLELKELEAAQATQAVRSACSKFVNKAFAHSCAMAPRLVP